LGANGSNEIKSHPWFEKVNWNALMTKAIKAPFVPILTSDADTSNFDEDFTSCSINSYTENNEMVDET
jgi:serum/glucocorticoid-regulated kinase 2